MSNVNRSSPRTVTDADIPSPAESNQENADVLFSRKLDEQTDVLLSNELGFVPPVALILS